ncbi:MAG: tetratricopeptide repeat protein [Woronichinia naegeliana WA131]|uniref:Tetratricopeptide repeat protein n=1 Tax=Woronichinia naegeliana WA131 TaxID=2824559 RepID=A0A977KZK0_9CYAN|nr:MAG: tetratricopeptide repeat protein [Woronichinia naegeliana WA131]
MESSEKGERTKLKSPYKLPVQNPNFVGRQTDLNTLHDRLQETKRLAITAVSGMGGIGKTALALQYAYEQADFYAEGRLWLTVGAGFAEEIVSFGRSPLQLGIDEGLAIAEKVRAVWQSWPGDSPVLIVIDNVNKEQDYSEIQPFLPTDARFKVLVTSRIKFAGVSDLPLDVLPLSEAVQLLETLAESEQRVWERGSAEVLCERLGRLPLAISLVGSYLSNDRGLTLADVTQQLQAKGLETGWLNQADPSVAERGLKAAIDLSWEILESRVQDFACFLSWFAYAPIPWYLVESAIAILNEPKPENSFLKKVWNFLNKPLFSQSSHSLTTPIPKEQTSPLNTEKLNFINSDLQDLRQILIRFHFLEIEDNTLPSYKIHPLLQQYLRGKATQQIDPDYRKGLVQAIIQEAQKIEYRSTVQQLEALRPALPHITEVAEVWIGDIMDEDNIIQPSNRLAYFYENLVDYPQAEYWYQKARTIAQDRLPAQHPAIATTLNNLALLYKSQGKDSEAEPLYLKALTIGRASLSPNSPLLASYLNNLASLYYSQGKYSEAEPLFQEALAIDRASLPPNHPYLARDLNNLALLYESQGKDNEAEPLYQEALSIVRASLPPNHPQLATHLNNLALLYKSQGKDNEAAPLYQEALTIDRASLPPNHPELATGLNNLAELYRTQGKDSEAEPLFLEALAICEQSLGIDHPNTVTCRRNYQLFLQQKEEHQT